MLGVRKSKFSTDQPGKRSGRKSAGFLSRTAQMAWTLALILSLVICASADDLNISQEHLDRWDCPACKGVVTYDLDIFNFLGHDFEDNTVSEKPPGPQGARAAMENSTERRREGFVHGEFLSSIEDAESSDVILDVGSDYATSHIKGAIPLYWDELLDENNNPKSAADMAEIFGNAGISPDDSVVIYGSCATCDGISVTPFVFWAMRYVGHDDVMVLDGGLDEWKDAGMSTEKRANERPAVTYTPPRVRSGLLADYDGVAGGEYQVVDARTLQEFAADKVQGAIHIDYDEVQSNGQVKSSEDLADAFVVLDEDEPIVVYSNAGARAAMVWYALQLMGYDSSIYTWNDWEAHRPPVKAVLKEARADPNPARPGPVKIYATFEVVPDEGNSATEIFATETAAEETVSDETVVEDAATETEIVDEVVPEDNGSNETNESIINGTEIEAMISEATSMEEPTVKTMGCVACFDPVTLYASGSNPSDITGGVKLGSVGRTTLAPITAAGALIQDQDGEVMATIKLVSTMSDEHVGTWDATGAPEGVYTVTLAAAAGGKTSYFEDVLTIEIDSRAPVQETATNAAVSTGFKKLGRY